MNVTSVARVGKIEKTRNFFYLRLAYRHQGMTHWITAYAFDLDEIMNRVGVGDLIYLTGVLLFNQKNEPFVRLLSVELVQRSARNSQNAESKSVKATQNNRQAQNSNKRASNQRRNTQQKEETLEIPDEISLDDFSVEDDLPF